MEAGDPKQLAVLGVLAVGALGFLATRLVGKHDAPVAAKASATPSASPRTAVAYHFGHDPFSHPRLAKKEDKHALFAAAPPSSTTPTKAVPFSIAGTLPEAGDGGPVVPPFSPKQPETDAGKAGPMTTTIALEAIAGASDVVAFLSVGGAESQPFHPNQRVAADIRLIRVGDGVVVLSGPKGRLTLGVGERKTL